MPVSSAPTLRNYQNDCLKAILDNYKAGIRRQLVCLPTGTGKTVVFAQFPSFLKMKKRMLVLAHRAELLNQARDKILSSNPSLKVEIEQAQQSASPGSDVIIASVPTLGRKNSKRLAALDPDQFYLTVVDEAHHAPAETYVRILEHLGFTDPQTPKLLVGFTATPKRGDGEGLDKVFDEIVFSRTLPEMIHEGFLAPVTGYRVETDVDLSSVHTRMGDFVAGQLSQAVNVDERNALVVKVYRDRLHGRKTLAFCVDVAHAQELAHTFNQHGVPAESVTGETPAEQRARTLAAFSDGSLKVLTNCMVLTEGYDEPGVEGILLARPTKSSLLYTQMIGRGTRLHPGKENVTVIDIVDNSHKHRLVTLPSLFGLQPHFDLKGKTTQEIERAMRWVAQHRPWVRTDKVANLDELRYRCTHVDLLQLDLPDELAWYANFAWTAVAPQTYRLGLGKGTTLTLARTVLGSWELTTRSPQLQHDSTLFTSISDLEKAIPRAEKYVKQSHADTLPLVDLQARWRHQPASEKQLQRIRAARLTVPEYITRGQASHLIAMLSGDKRDTQDSPVSR